MKRFHIHVTVKDLNKSVEFYLTLFGVKPSKLKGDYAKWMLEDPRLNFAISTRDQEIGVNHLGIQVDQETELKDISERLKQADLNLYDEGETACCYAKSTKAWVTDPAGIPWEAYQNLSDIDVFGETKQFHKPKSEESSCCVPDPSSACCG